MESDSTIVIENGQLVVRSAAGDLFRATSDRTGAAVVTTTNADSTVTFDVAGGTPANGLDLVGGVGNNVLQVLGDGSELDLTSMGTVVAQNFAVVDLSDPSASTIKIDVNAVRALASTANSIRLIGGDGDEISFADADQWRMGNPMIVGDQFMIAIDHADGVTVESEVVHAWQNVVRISDVNNSGDVTAGDALRIINELSRREFSDGDTQNLDSPIDVVDWPGVYFDQNGDDRATALDALRVINELARITLASGEEPEQVDFAIKQLLREIERITDREGGSNADFSSSEKLASFDVSQTDSRTIEVENADSFFESQTDSDQPLLEL